MDGEETVLDAGLDSAEVVETETSTTSEGEGELAPETPPGETPEGEQPEDKGDGRALPKDIQRALKTLRETPENAQVARALNDAYWREQAFAKVFAKPVDAQAAKATLELIGGNEGIEKMQADLRSMELVDADIAEGNPGFLDDIIKTSPEGFKKLAPHVLQKLYSLDKVAYGQMVAPPIYNTLKAYQIPQVLATLEGSQDPAAKTAAGYIKQLLTDLEDEVKNIPRQPAQNTEQEKVKGEWEKLHSERVNSTIAEMGKTVFAYQDQRVSKALAELSKNAPLAGDKKAFFMKNVNGEIHDLLLADKEYQRYTSAARDKIAAGIKAKQDVTSLKNSLVQYINAKMDDVAPKATRMVWSRAGYGSNGAARKTPAPPRTPAPQVKGREKSYFEMTEPEREAWRAKQPRA